MDVSALHRRAFENSMKDRRLAEQRFEDERAQGYAMQLKTPALSTKKKTKREELQEELQGAETHLMAIEERIALGRSNEQVLKQAKRDCAKIRKELNDL